MGRLKNQILARLFTKFPFLVERWVEKAAPWKVEGIPWAPVTKPVKDCKIAIVTTAGVHLKNQKPFDMHDPHGDPNYREIPKDTPKEELMITHDYYDHKEKKKRKKRKGGGGWLCVFLFFFFFFSLFFCWCKEKIFFFFFPPHLCGH